MWPQDSSEDEADSPSMVARAEGEEKRGNGEEKEESPRGKKLTTQGEEDEDKVEEMVQDTFSARVVIHEALHLPVCRAEPR